MNNIVKLVRSIIFSLSGLSHRNKNLMVFGSWTGDKVGDNTKYFLDYLVDLNQANMKLVWVGKKNLKNTVQSKYHDKVTFVEWGSILGYWYCLRASRIFVTSGYNDVGRFNVGKGAKIIQFWHGFPLKKISFDSDDQLAKEYHAFNTYAEFLSTSEVMTSRILSGFRNYGINKNNVLHIGQPRTDILTTNKSKQQAIVKQLKQRLGISADSFVVSYLPTFRDSKSAKSFSFSDIKDSSFFDKLKDKNIFLLEKQHYARNTIISEDQYSKENFIKIADEEDTQELLLITDLLITDFSSVYVDYLLLDRPVVHYLFDKDYYITSDRGLYNNNFLQEETAGPVIYEFNDLKDLILNHTQHSFDDEKRRLLNTKFNQYNKNSNSEVIWNWLR